MKNFIIYYYLFNVASVMDKYTLYCKMDYTLSVIKNDMKTNWKRTWRLKTQLFRSSSINVWVSVKQK